MSTKKPVQKKAPKKRAAVKEYPYQVATKKGQVPMSDAEFLMWMSDFAGYFEGETFADAMETMIECTYDGKFTKRQYKLLDTAISNGRDYRILESRRYEPKKVLLGKKP